MKKYFLISCLVFISCTTLSSQEVKPHDFVPEQHYHLKNGYELSITDAVKRNEHVCSIRLSKNGRTVVIGEMAYFNNLKYYPRYEGIDFDDFFAIEFFMGGYSCRLHEKKTGSKVLEFDTAGSRPVFEADNQLLIYSVDNEGDTFFPRSVYLYDLKNGKKHKLNEFLQKAQEKTLFWLNILNWFDSFEFGNITPENVEIVFYGCYKPLFDEAGEFFDEEDYRFSFMVER
ncbi:MAG: hypothetical protein K2J68_06750 [Treponemataceae bacterium]|nr:hypothetical protein [Treponemataceae bacterium]